MVVRIVAIALLCAPSGAVMQQQRSTKRSVGGGRQVLGQRHPYNVAVTDSLGQQRQSVLRYCGTPGGSILSPPYWPLPTRDRSGVLSTARRSRKAHRLAQRGQSIVLLEAH